MTQLLHTRSLSSYCMGYGTKDIAASQAGQVSVLMKSLYNFSADDKC